MIILILRPRLALAATALVLWNFLDRGLADATPGTVARAINRDSKRRKNKLFGRPAFPNPLVEACAKNIMAFAPNVSNGQSAKGAVPSVSLGGNQEIFGKR